MANLVLLTQRMKEKGVKDCWMAEQLNISSASFSAKKNGHRDFNQMEMSGICSILNLSKQDAFDIFLRKGE